MTITYQPQGVCSREIVIELDEQDVVRDIRFTGGCSGNTQGVSRLAVGLPAAEVVERLRGIRCGLHRMPDGTPTSCPDQLARAIEQALGSRDAAK